MLNHILKDRNLTIKKCSENILYNKISFLKKFCIFLSLLRSKYFSSFTNQMAP